MPHRVALALILLLVGGFFGPKATGARPELSGPSGERVRSVVSIQEQRRGQDFAALALGPSDIGLPGFVHVGAFYESLAAEAADVAAYRGRGLAPETVAATLGQAGWNRKYVAVLGLPGQSNPGQLTRIVRSYVTAYADPSGAAAGFAYLEDESAVTSAQDLPGTRVVGEGSELTRDRGGADATGRPFRSLDLTFRTGDLVAGVTVINYPARQFADPDPGEVEALAATLERRLTAPPAPGSTLGDAVLRLGGDAHVYATYDDAYYRRDGQDVPLFEEAAAASAERRRSYADASDVYQLWQGVDVEDGAGVVYGVTLARFPSDASAATWVDVLAATLGRNPYYGDLRPVPGVVTLGDQTVALAYSANEGGAEAPRAVLVAVRIGATVARVHLVPSGGFSDVPMAAVTALARAQADCLRARSCPTPAGIPGVLDAALAAARATPAAVTPGP